MHIELIYTGSDLSVNGTRSNEDAVAQGGAADGERLEELRYRLGGLRGCGCAWGDDVLRCEVFEVGHADVEVWWWCHVDCKYSFS